MTESELVKHLHQVLAAIVEALEDGDDIDALLIARTALRKFDEEPSP